VTDDLSEKRREKARQELGEHVLNELGGSAEQLAAMVDGAPDQIREAVVEAMERQQAYRSIDRRHAAEDEAKGIPGDRCCNAVCVEHRASEGQREVESPEGLVAIEDFGKRDFCAGGWERAQQCMFRMTEGPPSDPFARYPSYAEAIRMLMRAKLLEPDSFGKWNGTDFAFSQATSKLWWAYIDLLVETGKISAFPIETDDEDAMVDRGAQANAALMHLGLPLHGADLEVYKLHEAIRKLKERDVDQGDAIFALLEMLPEP